MRTSALVLAVVAANVVESDAAADEGAARRSSSFAPHDAVLAPELLDDALASSRPPNNAFNVSGAILTYAGASLAIGGALTTAIYTPGPDYCEGVRECEYDAGPVIAGIALGASGALMVAIGGPLWAHGEQRRRTPTAGASFDASGAEAWVVVPF